MITQSQNVLLEAIKSSLFGYSPIYPEFVNWAEVIYEAKAQTVLGLISNVIPVHNELSEHDRVAYVRTMYEQDKLVSLLNCHHIPFVIIKGCAAAIYYPKPYLRTMGDIDVLVPQDYFDKAVCALESSGYVYLHENPRHKCYTKGGVEVELHHHFSSSGFNVDDILDEAIGRREQITLNGYSFSVLPSVENGLVLLGHINQHLKTNSLGLRQVIDWEMYIHNVVKNNIEMDRFIDIVEKRGLLNLAVCVTKVCNEYLGLPESFDKFKYVEDSITRDFICIILNDGNLGRRENLLGKESDRSIRRASYNIKRHGFFSYMKKVGFEKSGLKKNSAINRALAFLCGSFYILSSGIKALKSGSRYVEQIEQGRRRYDLYRRLGVRLENYNGDEEGL